jgi:ADP-ribose pyrophosphatase YjhB (NUDIX family)
MSNFSGTLIIKDGKILLVQESHKEARGLWSFPLGHVDNGESQSEAAVRETK